MGRSSLGHETVNSTGTRRASAAVQGPYPGNAGSDERVLITGAMGPFVIRNIKRRRHPVRDPARAFHEPAPGPPRVAARDWVKDQSSPGSKPSTTPCELYHEVLIRIWRRVATTDLCLPLRAPQNFAHNTSPASQPTGNWSGWLEKPTIGPPRNAPVSGHNNGHGPQFIFVHGLRISSEP